MGFVLDLIKSHGATLVDEVTGKSYLDMFTFYASLALGINHPGLHTQTAKEKLLLAATTKPSNSDVVTSLLKDSINTFANYAMPAHMNYLFFISGGALAVENALKAAFDWKVRQNIAKGKPEKGTKIIHFKQAFHGRSGYTLSMTNTADPRKTQYFPTFDWPRIDNKDESLAIAQIKQALHDNPDDIAGLIIEPIQGEGGDNHFTPHFIQALQQLAYEYEFLFIVDEVQTGMGLTGKLWAYEHYGIEPDLLVFGKKTQVCGFMASNRLDEVEGHVFQTSSRINSTFGGGLVDFVRLALVCDAMKNDRLVENAEKMGAYLLEKLSDLGVKNCRGKGLMCAFDLDTTVQRNHVIKKAFDNGLIILGCGERSIRFRPMLCVEKTGIDLAIDKLQASLV